MSPSTNKKHLKIQSNKASNKIQHIDEWNITTKIMFYGGEEEVNV